MLKGVIVTMALILVKIDVQECRYSISLQHIEQLPPFISSLTTPTQTRIFRIYSVARQSIKPFWRIQKQMNFKRKFTNFVPMNKNNDKKCRALFTGTMEFKIRLLLVQFYGFLSEPLVEYSFENIIHCHGDCKFHCKLFYLHCIFSFFSLSLSLSRLNDFQYCG